MSITEYVREEIVALLAVNFNSYFNQTALEVGGSYWLYERSFLYYYFLYIFFQKFLLKLKKYIPDMDLLSLKCMKMQRKTKTTKQSFSL